MQIHKNLVSTLVNIQASLTGERMGEKTGFRSNLNSISFHELCLQITTYTIYKVFLLHMRGDEKQIPTEIYWKRSLTGSDLSDIFIQSIKFFTFHCDIIKNIWYQQSMFSCKTFFCCFMGYEMDYNNGKKWVNVQIFPTLNNPIGHFQIVTAATSILLLL